HEVRLSVSAGAPDTIVLCVEDDGPGLPEDRREAIFQRGVRMDERVPGSGLGLAIVRDLATAYGGSVHAEASALGGLSVVLVLPGADPAPNANARLKERAFSGTEGKISR